MASAAKRAIPTGPHCPRTSPSLHGATGGSNGDVCAQGDGSGVVAIPFSGDAEADARRIRALARTSPSEVPVVMAEKSEIRAEDVVTIMKAGAFDVVLTPIDEASLARRMAAARSEALRRRTRHDQGCEAAAYLDRLTPRERDVARELIAGASNKLAARRLALSPRTVEFHRARIFEKLEISSVAELASLAVIAQCARCWRGGEPPRRAPDLR